MPAPTLIASIQIDSPWSQADNILNGVTTKNYTGTLSTQAGDLIVALQGCSNSADAGILSTTDGTNTYTSRTHLESTNHCSINIDTAPDSAGGTRTITFNRQNAPNAAQVGGIAFQFRAHGGVGNIIAANDNSPNNILSAGAVNITCSANSAILVICADWNAVAGTQTWSINGGSPTSQFGVVGDGVTWGVMGAYLNDVGSSGSKNIRITSPTMTAPTFAVIEILAGAGGLTPRLSLLGVG